jgi:hypothetical protein
MLESFVDPATIPHDTAVDPLGLRHPHELERTIPPWNRLTATPTLYLAPLQFYKN